MTIYMLANLRLSHVKINYRNW